MKPKENSCYEDLTGDGGVLKRVTKAAAGERVVPENGDKVQVNYVGTHRGVEFDRNHGGYPFEFVIGEGKVVKGWEIAFPTIAVGESAELKLSAAYGYGDEGSPGDSKKTSIPPGATLVFQVELVAIKDGIKCTRAEEDRARLLELRENRLAAAEAAAATKEAKAKAKAEAAAKLKEKLANKGKKGKGGGSGTYVKKEKPEKAVKAKKGGGPTRAEKLAASVKEVGAEGPEESSEGSEP